MYSTKRQILYQKREEVPKPKASVYCSKKDHKSNEGKIATNVDDDMIVLNERRYFLTVLE